jgi:hypothetical protein
LVGDFAHLAVAMIGIYGYFQNGLFLPIRICAQGLPPVMREVLYQFVKYIPYRSIDGLVKILFHGSKEYGCDNK